MFGNLQKGYASDYAKTLKALFGAGICPHTIFDIPSDTKDYPVIVLSAVARLTDDEIGSLYDYIKSGGRVIVLGPTPLKECVNSWSIPNSINVSPEEFFTTVPDGIHVKLPDWVTKTAVDAPDDPDEWSEPIENLFYHPHRLGSSNEAEFISLCRKYMKQMPINVVEAKGYISTMFESNDKTVVQFLAEDYDVDIDHELDAKRNHRTRVNLLTKIEPIGIDGVLKLCSDVTPTVYTPFVNGESKVSIAKGTVTVTLPEKCSYAILSFDK